MRTTTGFQAARRLAVPAALVATTARAETMSPEVVLATLPLQETRPAIACNSQSDEYLAVWEEHHPDVEPAIRLVGRRLDRYGLPLSPTTTIGPGADGRTRFASDVAYDPTTDSYFVVHAYDYDGDGSDWDIRGRSVSPDLASFGPERIIAQSFDSEWCPLSTYRP